MVAEPSLPEEPSLRKAVYLVTVAHPQASHSTTGAQLRSPDTFTRDDLQRYLLDAFANPAYADSGNQAGSAGTSVQVLRMVVSKNITRKLPMVRHIGITMLPSGLPTRTSLLQGSAHCLRATASRRTGRHPMTPTARL